MVHYFTENSDSEPFVQIVKGEEGAGKTVFMKSLLS